jgi:hypothetical protein
LELIWMNFIKFVGLGWPFEISFKCSFTTPFSHNFCVQSFWFWHLYTSRSTTPYIVLGRWRSSHLSTSKRKTLKTKVV